MQVTEQTIQIVKEFITTGKQAESYSKFLGTGKKQNDKVNASNYFKKPEVKRLVKLLREEREKAMLQATQEVYTKMYADQIATEVELDIFHTEVLRGRAEMEEVFAVREKTLINKLVDGKVVPFLEEKVLFKRIKRNPTIKEKQVSASELYKRKGSYRGISKVSSNQDDQEAALKSKGAKENQPIERYVVLSNGERLPIM